MKQIGQGRTADIYEVDESRILKLYKKDIFHEAVEIEFSVSQFVYSLGMNTPKPLDLLWQDERRGIIFQRVSGGSLLDAITRRPLLVKKYAQILASLHAQLHAWEARDLKRKQKEILAYNIKSAPLLTEEEKNKIITYLHELPDDYKLCHGDFHPDNIMLGEQYWVIDWMTGAVGHPAGDAARTVILLSFGALPPGTPKFMGTIIQMLRKKIKNEYLKHYLMVTGRDFADIDPWILPIAAARLVEWVPEEEKNELLLEIKKRLIKTL
ncbi:phosphotransferase [Paenibacillus motobuensis]|uniref:aminoglycoside phosphotransferase family protein n=1 Tax=Paenibacillus TaxID=44249 RepID=UPI0020419323|nr:MULTISPECIES: aminoglycoside phosphotransferase family protein [Paenibacillus]MCM3039137.1 phosphotransferase [Paenibacillus lutimineralis]MCM3646241.1 phosphotransferase [Paenibacillus motobuensis]